MSFNESVDELVAFNETGLLGAHPSWTRVRLEDICSILNGFPFPSKQFQTAGGTPLIRIRDVMRGWSETSFVGSFDPAYIVSHGDLVVGMDGDFNCALWAGSEALLNQRVCKLTPAESFYDLSLLAYVLPGYLAAINAKTSAITVKHLSSKTVASIPLPLPPRSEQSRLVEAIESFLTRLDDAMASLERVQRNLKRYRASVLKAAVEGRLVPTEAELARTESREHEPALVLLERILVERRRRWEEAELAKMKAKGKVPKNDKWKAKYVEPAAPDTSELPELPEGWCWARTEQCVMTQVGHAFSSGEFIEEGVNLLRGDNIGHGSLRWDGNRRRCIRPEALLDYAHLKLEPSDIVLAMDRPIISTGLKFAHVQPSDLPALLVQRVIRMRPSLHIGYFDANIQSQHFIEHLEQEARGGGVPHISEGQIKDFVFPLPPFAEQVRIAQEVERLLSTSESSIKIVLDNAQRVTRLRQSILKWAFEGRLVDQDPTDEPAEVLLERIRAERAAQPSRSRRSRP